MRLILLAIACSIGCSSSSALQKRDDSSASSAVQTKRRDDSSSSSKLQPRDDLMATLRASGYDGAFVAWEADGSNAVCVGGARCDTRYPPASTFKVPHALLALDLGVLSGPEHEFKWDGKKRWLKSWNRDHTLRTSMRHSTVWYFRRLAPMIGKQRMSKGLARMSYGNQNIGAKIDQFWLDGSIAISPVEQVRFWHALHENAFDMSKRARAHTLDITTLGKQDGYTLRAKTGWDRRPGKTNHGWLAGCVDGPKRICFATVLFVTDPFDHKKFISARFSVSAALLAKLGYKMPARN